MVCTLIFRLNVLVLNSKSGTVILKLHALFYRRTIIIKSVRAATFKFHVYPRQPLSTSLQRPNDLQVAHPILGKTNTGSLLL